MSKPLRLFVGISPSDAWSDALERATEQVRKSLGGVSRWVRPELYHVTVVFLGDQQPAAVCGIEAALMEATADVASFSLRLAAIRRLGGHERGALVAGVQDESGGLLAFRRQLDAALQARGIPFDSKPLVPHVTLARPRGRGSWPLVAFPDLSGAPPLRVERIHLMQSTLFPSGPIYTPLLSADLA